ncbi:unnamed protein product [Heligmosomoides polygyrus]|uniref:Uncharacterized protein n=1 Tax=Heligmosomoides polygyrus TaxID=6339 RepID=A0A183GEV4_HELPZ|nr:unnamed protein product [Heligmosomoides polygyrus]
MQRERQNDGRIKGKKKKNSDEYYYYPDAPQGQGEGDPDIFYDNEGRVDQPARTESMAQNQQVQGQVAEEHRHGSMTQDRAEKAPQQTGNVCTNASRTEVPDDGGIVHTQVLREFTSSPPWVRFHQLSQSAVVDIGFTS